MKNRQHQGLEYVCVMEKSLIGHKTQNANDFSLTQNSLFYIDLVHNPYNSFTA